MKKRVADVVSRQERQWKESQAGLEEQTRRLSTSLQEEQDRSYEAVRLEHAQRAAMKRCCMVVGRTARSLMRIVRPSPPGLPCACASNFTDRGRPDRRNGGTAGH